MSKLKMLVMAVGLLAVASTANTAEAASRGQKKKPVAKRAVRRAPVVHRSPWWPVYTPDSVYGDRMPRSGRGTCGNSNWPCGGNNGGGDPHGSGGGGG